MLVSPARPPSVVEAQRHTPLVAAVVAALAVYSIPAEAAWSLFVVLSLCTTAALAVVLRHVSGASHEIAALSRITTALTVGGLAAVVALQSVAVTDARRGLPPMPGRLETITGTLREALGTGDSSAEMTTTQVMTSRGRFTLERSLRLVRPEISAAPRRSDSSGGGSRMITAATSPAAAMPRGTTVFVEVADEGGASVRAESLAAVPRPSSALRGKIRAYIRELSRAYDLELLAPLLIGARDSLNAVVERSFREAGAMHMLALSGMHLALFVAVVYAVTRQFGSWQLSLVAASLFILLFLWIAGPRPSLVRAVLLTLLAGGAVALRRRTAPLNLLAGAFILMLILWPTSIKTLSFQLSFSALLGILLAAPALSYLGDGFLPRVVRMPLAAGLGAQFATAPLLAASFGVVYPVGVLTGVLLAPVVTLYLWGGLAGSALAALGLDAMGNAVLLFLHGVEGVIQRIVAAAAMVPGVRLTSPAAWVSAILIIAAFWLSVAELLHRRSLAERLRRLELRELQGGRPVEGSET